MADQCAGVVREIGKMRVFPNVVAFSLAGPASRQKRQEAVRLMGDEPVDDELGLV